ncbi:hypothetical protein OPQ81_009355 [Rhizoctonia solani]|nr:hypothetical protein OPQ81_009355 [Rhizoctonia solani]
MNSTLHSTITLIHGCITQSFQSLPRRDRPSSQSVRRLAQSISLVCLNIRTACLVDFCRIASPQRTLPHLIDNLRQKGCTGCAHIFAIFDSVGGDVFFVNSTMFSHKLDGSSSHDSDTESDRRPPCSASIKLENVMLISLDKPLRVLESLPEPLVSLLSYLQSHLVGAPRETCSDKRVSDVPPVLGSFWTTRSLTSLPARAELQENKSFLSGEALDVFEISLRSSETAELLELMKFSCPSEFSNPEPLATSILTAIHGRLAPIIEYLNSKMDGALIKCVILGTHFTFWLTSAFEYCNQALGTHADNFISHGMKMYCLVTSGSYYIGEERPKTSFMPVAFANHPRIISVESRRMNYPVRESIHSEIVPEYKHIGERRGWGDGNLDQGFPPLLVPILKMKKHVNGERRYCAGLKNSGRKITHSYNVIQLLGERQPWGRGDSVPATAHVLLFTFVSAGSGLDRELMGELCTSVWMYVHSDDL